MLDLFADEMTEYVLKEATREQWYVSLERQVVQWSGGMSWPQFKDREERLGATAFGKHMRCWALVPRDDPTSLSFPCSCETFRRPAFVKKDGRVRKVVSYSIASVFADPKQRGKGHASKMMTLLHDHLRLEGDLVDWPSTEADVAWRDGQDGVASYLFSDVGDFYSRCGKPGWTIISPIQTTWKLDALPQFEPQQSLKPIAALDFGEIAAADEEHLRTLVENSSANLAFAPVPQGINYVWRAERSICYAQAFNVQVPQRFGMQTSDGQAFVTWFLNHSKNHVEILRLKGTPEQCTQLIREAFVFAREHKMKQVIGWNFAAEVLNALPEDERGETKERSDSLSALAWYATNDEARSIDWIANEYFAWC